MEQSRTRGAVPVVLAVAALAFAGWAGWSWWSAAHDESRQFAVDRSAVVDAAQQDLVRMNTLDYRKVDEGMKSWLDVSTGTLHEQLAKTTDDGKKQLAQAKTVTSAKLLDSAVTALDQRAGTARLIASVEVEVTPETGDKVTKRNRFQAELTRTDQGWKLSALAAVPAGGV
ncbi:hypothetical protein GCM10010174_17590 [Kutzneria viridogrisea]|uniref:Mce-associated membrane protein n=1 Tax=Kutzneria viridogrisea TaxID=47990 RepID=A0ABR6BD87_9PSEU|nr:Mce-associated membrane protein [Kutzneria viridogrisea]